MDNKIQELAEKIYRDGVERANEQADEILKQAETKRQEILRSAQAEADAIISSAKKDAEDSLQHSESEIKLSVSNAMEALQTQITDSVNGQAVSRGIDLAFAKPDALYQTVAKMTEQLFAQGSNGVEVSTADAKSLEDYFRTHAAELLDKGLQIKEVAGKSAVFDVAPKEGGYKVQVSKEAFVEYFKDFMRPRLRKILFGDQTRS